MEIKENDIIMCTVKSIEGTTVFVNIDEGGSGSISFSEIAAGRIRNIREYVSQSKKIVCKVLKIYPDHFELSLRRVTGKEREEIQNRYKRQKIFINILKASVKDHENIIKKIKESYEVWDFFDQIKEDPKILDKFLKKSESDSLIQLLSEKQDKEKEVRKMFTLKAYSDNGLSDIKEILNFNKDIFICYLGSSKFSVSSKGKDYKDAEHKVDSALKQIESRAKEKKAIFEIGK